MLSLKVVAVRVTGDRKFITLACDGTGPVVLGNGYMILAGPADAAGGPAVGETVVLDMVAPPLPPPPLDPGLGPVPPPADPVQ